MPANKDELRKPFPPELIGKLPGTSKRPALDYVNHAVVTDRLLQYGGDWEFKVLNDFAAQGAYWVRAALTIDGVTREEYGEGPDPKKAISDALKRAAMRFGVALDLWTKEDLGVEGQPDARTAPARSKRPPDPKPPTSVPPVGVTGKDPAGGTTSKGGAASTGGSKGTASPKDNPWEGLDVV